jgi:hypothetical protein
MKKQIVILLMIAATLVACEKSPFDSRNKYLGNYDFTNLYSDVDSSGTISNRTTTYFGRAYAEGDNNVIIQFEANKSQSIRIDNDGNLYNSCDKYIGRFESESRIQAGLNKQSCASINLDENSSVAIVGNRRF